MWQKLKSWGNDDVFARTYEQIRFEEELYELKILNRIANSADFTIEDMILFYEEHLRSGGRVYDTCVNPEAKPEVIRARLKMSPARARSAVAQMQHRGYEIYRSRWSPQFRAVLMEHALLGEEVAP